MRELKVQCDCGQKFKFDVEPVNNQMPFTVACPVCARDGTEKANMLLRAQAAVLAPIPIASIPLTHAPMAPAPVTAPAPVGLAPAVPPAGEQARLRINAAAHAETAPPVLAPSSPPPIRAAQAKAKPPRHDGWGAPETDFNKKGSYIVLLPSVFGGMISAGYIPIQIPALYIFIAVIIGGLAGGYINILGRGPIWAGMIVGLVMGIGGYGAVYWWMLNHDIVRKYEVGIAFVVGAAPGFGLQYLLQWILKKRSELAAEA